MNVETKNEITVNNIKVDGFILHNLRLIVVEPITDNFNIASTIVVTNTIWYNPDHKLYYKNNDDSE